MVFKELGMLNDLSRFYKVFDFILNGKWDEVVLNYWFKLEDVRRIVAIYLSHI